MGLLKKCTILYTKALNSTMLKLRELQGWKNGKYKNFA
jgi:hypothetical protein